MTHRIGGLAKTSQSSDKINFVSSSLGNEKEPVLEDSLPEVSGRLDQRLFISPRSQPGSISRTWSFLSEPRRHSTPPSPQMTPKPEGLPATLASENPEPGNEMRGKSAQP